MIGKPILILLLFIYAAMAISAAFNKQWNLVLYWVGAFTLNTAVLRMAY